MVFMRLPNVISHDAARQQQARAVRKPDAIMKSINTLFVLPLMMGLGLFTFEFGSRAFEKYGLLECCLALAGLLLIALIACTLLNLAVFAPVYWFLGRMQSKSAKTGSTQTTRLGF
jgi:uncharacterized BrkB/YihY/UPF0761 family membrane protein